MFDQLAIKSDIKFYFFMKKIYSINRFEMRGICTKEMKKKEEDEKNGTA